MVAISVINVNEIYAINFIGNTDSTFKKKMTAMKIEVAIFFNISIYQYLSVF